MQVMNNLVKAEMLLQQADDMEAMLVSELTDKSSHVIMFQQGHAFDTSREDSAVIAVTQSLANIGAIESTNSVALTMFGYSKREMIGKNISMIVPYPMAVMHDTYLTNYIATGHSVRAAVCNRHGACYCSAELARCRRCMPVFVLCLIH